LVYGARSCEATIMVSPQGSSTALVRLEDQRTVKAHRDQIQRCDPPPEQAADTGVPYCSVVQATPRVQAKPTVEPESMKPTNAGSEAPLQDGGTPIPPRRSCDVVSLSSPATFWSRLA
ncbi:hypothetical protein BOX15_Mlig023930g1, partial [Macrostomum lignano]